MKKKIKPQKGQESVWDYPRPPKLERVNQQLRVEFGGELIADSTLGFRVLETSHPPVYYIPQQDIKMEFLILNTERPSMCEFKGKAVYWDLKVGAQQSPRAAWSYPDPRAAEFLPIKDFLAFYASKVDACFVGDEKVNAQEGDFYGGWITKNIVGPFKGGPGTWGW